MLLLSLALAQDYVVEIGAEVGLGQNGTFSRALWTNTGWMLAYGAGQDFHVAPLKRTGTSLEAWALDDPNSVRLTDHGALRDHSIAQCPDGTWLHLGSSSLTTHDDSAYAFHYSADWQRLGQGVVAENVDYRSHNDMVAFCVDEFWGSTFPHDGEVRNYFVTLDATLQPMDEWEIAGWPRMTGGAMLEDGEHLWAVGFDHRPEMWVVQYDRDLNQLDRFGVEVQTDGLRSYWSQGFIKIGEVFLVAHMMRDEEGWGSNDDVGNVQLVLFDEDWQLLEKHTLTFNDHDDAGQRPHLVWDGGDTLLMSYDRALELSVLHMRIDPTKFFTEPADTNPPEDTGPSDDSASDTGTPEPPEDCGCGGAGGVGLLLPHLLIWVGRRRRDGEA